MPNQFYKEKAKPRSEREAFYYWGRENCDKIKLWQK